VLALGGSVTSKSSWLSPERPRSSASLVAPCRSACRDAPRGRPCAVRVQTGVWGARAAASWLCTWARAGTPPARSLRTAQARAAVATFAPRPAAPAPPGPALIPARAACSAAASLRGRARAAAGGPAAGGRRGGGGGRAGGLARHQCRPRVQPDGGRRRGGRCERDGGRRRLWRGRRGRRSDPCPSRSLTVAVFLRRLQVHPVPAPLSHSRCPA